MFVVALVMMMYINRAVGFARVPAFTVRRGALSVLRGAEEQEKIKQLMKSGLSFKVGQFLNKNPYYVVILGL